MASQTSLVQRLFTRIGKVSGTSKQDKIVDDISRLIASPLPRRSLLKLMAMSISGAVVGRFGGGPVHAQQTACCNGMMFNPSMQCCTSQGIQNKHPITDLAACPDRVPHPGHNPAPNGCGTTDFKVPNGWGEADFLPCCNGHDTCWGTCNNSRSGCDGTFFSCLQQSCSVYRSFLFPELELDCLFAAEIYYLAVDRTSRGTTAYENAQKEACDCCGSPGGQGGCGNSGVCCGPGQTCVNGMCTNSTCTGATCGSFSNCGTSSNCFCFTSSEGAGGCANNALCAGLPACSSSSQCGGGSVCAVNTCCGAAGVCLTLCSSSNFSPSGLSGSKGPTASGAPLRR